MGQTIHSLNDMMSYAGDLRRAAKQAEPQTAAKMQQASAQLEKTALAQVSDAGPMLGKLLDTFA